MFVGGRPGAACRLAQGGSGRHSAAGGRGRPCLGRRLGLEKVLDSKEDNSKLEGHQSQLAAAGQDGLPQGIGLRMGRALREAV